MSVPTPAHPLEIFFSYSHRDEKMRSRLEAHLSSLKRERLISGWHDRKIKPGTEWKGQIDAHLDSSQIILLLISADFLASDYCYDVEMDRALARHDSGEARVHPDHPQTLRLAVVTIRQAPSSSQGWEAGVRLVYTRPGI